MYIKWTTNQYEVAEMNSELITFNGIKTDLELFVVDPP